VNLVLANLPEADRARLLEVCRPKQLRRGDSLANEGDLGNALYIVREGNLAVRASTEDGNSILLDIVGPGAILGEMALVRVDRTRSASITALTDGVVLVLSAERYEALKGSNSSLTDALLTIMAERVDRLTRQLTEVLFLSVDRRIARRIWQIAELYGGRVAGTKVPLTQQDIADLVGATRPTVNQSLSKLADRGAIQLNRGSVTIANPKELQRRAGLS
jgi:CRP-like cAMP-binding protein